MRKLPTAADTTPTPAIPCVVYAARSQAEEQDKNSTGDQVSIVLERVGQVPDRFVYGEPHIDHASGYRSNRGPGLVAAVAAAERAKAEHGAAELWVWITSRLGRGTGRLGEARAVGHLLYELKAKGITVRSVEDDEFAVNEMLWGFASRMASKYSEDLAANVKRGIHSRAEKGLPWGEPAYGYGRGDDGHWIVRPHEAIVVRRIFAERVERGLAYQAIAQLLNAEGIRSRRGSDWTATVVRRILTTRMVLGEFRHAGEWRQGQHPALVDEDVWQTAQTLAEQGKKYARRGAGRVPKRHLLVKGMLRCVCGAAMLPRSDGDVYVCRRRKATGGAGTCDVPPLKRASIEAPLLKLFEEFALDVAGTRERVTGALSMQLDGVRSQVDRAGPEAAEKRAQAQRVESDYLAGKLGAETFERLFARLADDLKAADAEVARLEAHAAEVERLGANVDTEHNALRRLAELRAEVSRHVSDAAELSAVSGDVGALRAAITAVFETVQMENCANVFAAGVGEVHDTNGYAGGTGIYRGALFLLPTLRGDIVRDWREWADPNGSPFDNLTRVPLGLAPQNPTTSGVPEYPAVGGAAVMGSAPYDAHGGRCRRPQRAACPARIRGSSQASARSNSSVVTPMNAAPTAVIPRISGMLAPP
jgi:DNA invertase Pin-like site-specific DNA recombinase